MNMRVLIKWMSLFSTYGAFLNTVAMMLGAFAQNKTTSGRRNQWKERSHIKSKHS